jgi:hypothetical protein
MRSLEERFQGLRIYRVTDEAPPGAPVYEVMLQMKLECGTLPHLRRKIAAVVATLPKAKRSRWQDAKLR